MYRDNKGKFSILQWNCRSILKNYNHLLQFLSQHEIYILSLQSLNTSVYNLPKIPNFYYPPETNSINNSNKIYTAIYINSNFSYVSIPSPIPLTMENTFSCSIQFKIDKTTFTLLSVYLPKGPNKTNTDWLKNISSNNKNEAFIITGDYNAHSSFWEQYNSTVTSKKFVDNIIDSPFYLLNDGQITRIPDNPNHKPTAIDLTLVSPSIAPICTWNPCSDPLNSDHLPILITLNFKSSITQNQTSNNNMPKFNFKKADWEKFNMLLSLHDINSVSFSNLSVEEMSITINDLILSSAKASIPQIKTNQFKKHTGNPWWNEECEKARKNKWLLYKAYLKTPTKDNLLLAKQAKNLSNRTIEKAKESYWKDFCGKYSNSSINIQEIWQKVKCMKNNNQTPSYPIEIENNKLPSDLEKANAFVKYFAFNSTISGLQESNKTHRENIEKTQPLPDINNLPSTPNNINTDITLEELTNHIQSLNSNKNSLGPDFISNKMIKNLAPKILNLLLILFNKCFNTGTLPSLWKHSITIPIHKSGKTKNDVNNYRPIALTSNICKLFEKIIQDRLLFFCNSNNIIPQNQAGFRKGRSTTEHLLKLTTQIKHQFSRRKNILATFFDIKKAFDQVWHHKLIQKLIKINLDKKLILVIQNFLSDRYIQVKIGNCFSNLNKLDMGVPQGSVLSPLLFNLFIADLPSIFSKQTELTQFADDICFWQKVTLKKSTPLRTILNIEEKYQNEINKINNYITEIGLSFSTEKTKLVLFNSGPNPHRLPQFYLGNSKLNYTNTTTFLGITLTSKLNWSNHFEKIINNSRKGLNLLKVISSYKWGQNTSTLRTLAIALIRSKLTYAQEIFFNAPKHLLEKIQSIDCKSFKIALGIPFHTNNLNTYYEINISPLNFYRKTQSAKFIIKSFAQNNFCINELHITSEDTYPIRGKTIKSLQPIRSYANATLNLIEFNENKISPTHTIPQIPSWVLQKPKIITEYLNVTKKSSQAHILKNLVLEYIYTHFPNYLQVFTDGSKLDNDQVGAAFFIPKGNISKIFYIGKNFSIFTAELLGIYQALKYIYENNTNSNNILFCIDSKSTLICLQNYNNKYRTQMIQQIQHLIHLILTNKINLTFLWIPSHCNIPSNDKVDNLAKKGAQNISNAIYTPLKFDLHELYFHINTTTNKEIINLHNLSASTYSKLCVSNPNSINPSKIWKSSSNHRSFTLYSLISKLRLNSLKTKYTKSIKCICGLQLTIDHILLNCPKLQIQNLHKQNSLDAIFNSPSILLTLANYLLSSPISIFL